MVRTAVLVALIALGCSKKKEEAPAAPPPPPPAADAAVLDAASGSAQGEGGSARGSDGSGSAVGSDAAAGSDAGSGSAVAASDFDFDKLSKDDKVKFMKQKVMPTMKPLFQKFDPKEFAKVTCKTCHGKDPQGSKYKMPTADLPKLDFDAIKAGKEDPKVVEFMSKVVKPEMAKLLNKPEMTETVHNGFGCLDCHQMKKK